MGRLVIVSNRVSIPEKNAKARAGGLEVAVKAALKHRAGIWFGWSGKVAAQTKIVTPEVVRDNIAYITLDLSKEDHGEYYNGFANRVLWPSFHYLIDLRIRSISLRLAWKIRMSYSSLRMSRTAKSKAP